MAFDLLDRGKLAAAAGPVVAASKALGAIVAAAGVAAVARELVDAASAAHALLGILTFALLVATGLGALAVVLLFVRELTRTPAMIVDDPPPRFSCRVLDSADDTRILNSEVAPLVFPDSLVALEEAIKAQAINNQRIVGMIDTNNNQIIGWAAVWPVKAEVGARIEKGELADDDLTAEDLLPRSRNRHARYLVVLAIGLLPAYRALPERLVLKLGSALLWHIHEVFLGNDSQTVRVLALGYSEQGKKMAEAMGLKANGKATVYKNVATPLPVHAGDISRPQLRETIRRYFG